MLENERGKSPFQPTDFASLQAELYEAPKAPVLRTGTDLLIDILTPALIFVMVCAVGFFLLDVRYIYTGEHDLTLRMVMFFFTLGIVALNRLVSCEETGKSFAYFLALAFVITLYTLTLSSSGSIARDFMGQHPALSVAFNLTVMAFFWWMVNRLTYECCLDENLQSGEVGLMTGTLRQWKARLQGQKQRPSTPPKSASQSALENATLPVNVINAYDPTDPDAFKKSFTSAEASGDDSSQTGRRPPKGHPGISVFYFSVPVMLCFTLGLRAIQHGGEAFLRRGDAYLLTYTGAALSLLMLTSLGGLRAYLRSRQLAMPARIGWFWIGLGLLMVIYVLIFALLLPRPSLPSVVHVDRHVQDTWFDDPDFELQEVPEPLAPSPFFERLQVGALVILGLFLLIGIPRGLAALIQVLKRLHLKLPRPVHFFLNACEKNLLRITNWPRLPRLRRPIRIQRNIATCARYENPYAQTNKPPMSIREQISYAYEALCALAYDLGVPRETSETPLEFMAHFPKVLNNIEEEARELTQLYLIAAYTNEPLDEQALRGRLQQFWTVYRRLRNRIVR